MFNITLKEYIENASICCIFGFLLNEPSVHIGLTISITVSLIYLNREKAKQQKQLDQLEQEITNLKREQQ